MRKLLKITEIAMLLKSLQFSNYQIYRLQFFIIQIEELKDLTCFPINNLSKTVTVGSGLVGLGQRYNGNWNDLGTAILKFLWQFGNHQKFIQDILFLSFSLHFSCFDFQQQFLYSKRDIHHYIIGITLNQCDICINMFLFQTY